MQENKRKEILETALNLTTGDRNKSYGDPLKNLECLAALVNAYIHARCPGLMFKLNATDMAVIMNLTKVSRVAVNHNHADNYVDGAAYMAIAGECASRINVPEIRQPEYPINWGKAMQVNPIDKHREAIKLDPSRIFDGIESLKQPQKETYSPLRTYPIGHEWEGM